MRPDSLGDKLYLWWLADPQNARWIGTLRLVRKAQGQYAGVALRYGSDWLQTGFALSEDLPLRDMEFLPMLPDQAVGAVDDARPDRWGERVIRYLINPQRLSTLDFLFFAGDQRFGALGVSLSQQAYVPYPHGALPVLEDVQAVHDLVRQVEAGGQVSQHLARLVSPGATLGGAKPKALLDMDGAQWVLKFADANDHLDMGLVEHACMGLACLAGIDVCETRPLAYQSGQKLRHALAIKRFDRNKEQRLHALSAHVALRASGLDYGYPEMALLLRRLGVASNIKTNAIELFRRMVFNILMDNTDDHEKNHAFLWHQQALVLTPAFDVLPTHQGLGYQSIRVGKEGSVSSLTNALSDHLSFGLHLQEAKALMDQVKSVTSQWQQHFAQAGVSAADIESLSQTLSSSQSG
jgi:serine/threonine-protein kinase HipA